jgi:hypothetical protein
MLKRMLIVLVVGLAAACSGGAKAPPTGQGCMKVSDCYPGLDAGALSGMVVCLPLQGGYCSHTCTADTDCCKVAGECPTGIKEVCSPLQSNAATYCFVSCDTADITPTADGGTDPNSFCKSAANPSFTCRSTGGGSANRKFCGP